MHWNEIGRVEIWFLSVGRNGFYDWKVHGCGFEKAGQEIIGSVEI